MNRPLAELMAWAFELDMLACFALSGRLTLVALIRAPGVVTRILTHMGLSAEVPWIRPARPANPLLTLDVQGGFSYNQEDLRGLSEK